MPSGWQGSYGALGYAGSVSDLLPCPVCSEPAFTTRMEELDIPYFGEVFEMVYTCDACGFRRADFHIVNEQAPVRYTLEVNRMEDLSVRVVRSGSGHFEIPELGIRATPSEAADAFVSNVEGVLGRCEEAVITARNGAETDEARQRADQLLELIDRMREGDETFTLILEDALGNSAIVHDKAVREELSDEEAEELGHPYAIVDLQEMREQGMPDVEP